MKVAIMHENFPFGGKEEVTRNISNFLADRDVTVFIYSCLFTEKTEKGKSIIYNEFPDSNLLSLENADFLIEQINSNEIDVLLIPDYNLPYLSDLKDKTKCKLVFALHSIPFWEIELKYQCAKRRSEKSILGWLEWNLIQRFRYDILKSHKRRFEEMYKSTVLSVDAYVTLTEEYSELIRKKLNSKNKSVLRSISNAITPQMDIDLSTKQKEIIFVGRLSYADKRVDRLLNIWKGIFLKYPDWKLRIIGDGPELTALKNIVLEYNLKNVVFEGYHQNVVPFYRNASIICMTSSFEGWPLVLGEAQSYGVVPVAFNCSAGVADILSPDGVNGILVPPFDMELYSKQLSRLMSDDKLRKKIAEAVILKSKEYSPDIIGQKWLDLFQSLTSN